MKRKRLGQHFLISKQVAQKIVKTANITKDDTVYEIGTGRGILIPFLCKKAKKVISIEADKNLFLAAQEKFSAISNLTLMHGNGFKTNVEFSVFISNLPYSQSRKAFEWLIQKKFANATIMVQKEFAEKLGSKGKDRRAISVLANHALDIKKGFVVSKKNFEPEPKVDSVVLYMEKKNAVSSGLIKTVNKIFSYRRKKLQGILKQFDKKTESDKRLDELDGEKIIEIAKQIIS